MAAISIVIPTYNSVDTIVRSIDSVLAQTFTDWEILVVDDASTDRTVEVVQKRYGGDARVSILRRETNGGPALARNMAFQCATADWIALLDSDDAWSRDRLTILYSNRDGFDFIADRIMTYDSQAHTETGPLFETFEASILTLDDLLLGWVGDRRVDAGYLKPLMRLQFLRDFDLIYDSALRHGEDFVFYCEALCRRARFGLLSDLGYIYTTQVGKVSKQSSPYSRTTPDPIAMSKALQNLSHKYSASLDTREREALHRLSSGLAQSKWAWMYEAARSKQQYGLCIKLLGCHSSVLRHILRTALVEMGLGQTEQRPARS